jgi:predicted nucleic acid-binding Zn ribbon protein
MARIYKTPVIQKGSVLLNSVLKDTGLYFELEQRALLGKWTQVVGESLAKKLQLVDVDRGCLYCKVKNAGWKAEISFMKDEIIEKSNEVLGKKINTRSPIHSLKVRK